MANNQNQDFNRTTEEELNYDQMDNSQMTQDQTGKKGGRADDFDFDVTDYSQDIGQDTDSGVQNSESTDELEDF